MQPTHPNRKKNSSFRGQLKRKKVSARRPRGGSCCCQLGAVAIGLAQTLKMDEIMPKVTFVAFNGTEVGVEISEGDSVMSGATNNGISGIVGECGGFCSCATCHIYIDEAWAEKLPPMTEHEDEMLEGTASERKSTSRLSCQVKVTAELDGLVVHTPEIQNI
jgi:2Fe-2S ferredoxin